MNWLRSKAKQLSLLALFALAVQFGLSFGHTHLDRALGAQAAITQASAATPDAGHDTDGGNDICAICATIALANTLIDSVPPVLLVPADARAVNIATASLVITTATQRSGFQSRAPPQS